MGSNNNTLLEVQDLYVTFPLDEGTVQAVHGISMTIKRGQVLGVVGESGSGKSVTAQAILRIIPQPGRIDSGAILLHRVGAESGESQQIDVIDLTQLDPNGRDIRNLRGGDIAMIFQEPMVSFSPVHTIGNQMMEAILLHRHVNKEEAREIAVDMLAKVGISDPAHRVDQYSFELSGGMRQRAMIALALTCSPSLLIADEPTTALDVTIQAQILGLMQELREEIGMAIMFITHNLGVIAQIAEEVVVMYLGRVMEHGTTREIFHNPKHPYTVNLLRAIPHIGQPVPRLTAIEGQLPSPFERPPGCPFHPRCHDIIPGRCDVQAPQLIQVEPGHTTSCFLYE
jgi:oligopeptide/dipeptide ABC transporter ATP-binding protein